VETGGEGVETLPAGGDGLYRGQAVRCARHGPRLPPSRRAAPASLADALYVVFVLIGLVTLHRHITSSRYTSKRT
jgi:hypothetical protein